MITEKFIIKDSIQYIKYMGSKTKILPFIIDGIEDVFEGGSICDLFSGSCSLSGAIGDQVPVISNDIQEYSAIIAKSLLTDWYDQKITSIKIIEEAKKYHSEHFKSIVEEYKYPKDIDLDSFNLIEKKNQELINFNFSNNWHLFTKNYSGTW